MTHRDQPRPPALEVKTVSKSFASRTVLDDVTLSVAPGQATVLRGPNGAGKSTLLGCIAGTVVPDQGHVVIAGHNLRDAPIAARAALRYLPQQVEMPDGMTGRELLELSATIFGANAASIEAAATITGLGDALDRLATTYSVGMRRLVAFGSLMLGNPALLVLDEPLAGVDADGRARVIAATRRMQQDGAGLVIAAHDRDSDDIATLAPTRFDLSRAAEVS